MPATDSPNTGVHTSGGPGGRGSVPSGHKATQGMPGWLPLSRIVTSGALATAGRASLTFLPR